MSMNILEISKFILLMAVIYLSRPLVMFLPLSLMFLYHLVLPPILCLSVSWLKMIVNWNFSNLIVLCRINSQGGWSRRGLKWDVFSLFNFLCLLFLCPMSLVILLMLIAECGINVSDIQTLMFFMIYWNLVFLEIKIHHLLVLFSLIAILVVLAKVKLCPFLWIHTTRSPTFWFDI